MARDVHDGLIARTTYRKIRDERVPVVVPPSRHLGIPPDILPGCFESCNGPRWITGAGPPKWKDIPLRASLAKFLFVPDRIFSQDRKQRGIQRNCSAFPGFCFALPYD